MQHSLLTVYLTRLSATDILQHGMVRRLMNNGKKATVSFVMSVCLPVRPHGTTHLPFDGFSRNLIFEYFLKISRDNSIFIEI